MLRVISIWFFMILRGIIRKEQMIELYSKASLQILPAWGEGILTAALVAYCPKFQEVWHKRNTVVVT